MSDSYYTILKDRSALLVTGEDAGDFLQGLITQDINLLNSQDIIYSALLTPQGKMDYDFFILKHEGGFLIDCEGSRAQKLMMRLKMFILRRKVSINLQKIQVVTAWGDIANPRMFQLIPDPRNALIGYRRIIAEDVDFKVENDLKITDLKFYHELCIKHTIPHGSADIAWGNDSAADINLEGLNGVSYDKGCYMGQELTSRMHHRNLGKKGLYTVSGPTLPEAFTDINLKGHLIGQMRSSVNDVGIALLKHDSIDQLADINLIVMQG